MLFRSIPFLFELKNFIDWTITKTSLGLMQWIRMEEIHASLFFAQGSSKKFKNRKHGKPVSTIKKIFLGGCSVLFILILLFGPMLFFSDLNPSSQRNLVIGCGVELGLWIGTESYYKFYSNSLISKIEAINDTVFQNQFNSINYFQTIDKSMFQMVSLQENAESNWDITEPNFLMIIDKLNKTINKIENFEFTIQMTYSFTREV